MILRAPFLSAARALAAISGGRRRAAAARFAAGVSIVTLLSGAWLSGQEERADTAWTTYGGDLANTRYAPLDQIDRTNFNDLEIAWRFKTDNLGATPEFNFQSTPLVAGGVLYSTAGSRRSVLALDAATGELLWVHRMDEGRRAELAPRRLSGRGLAYWSDGRSARIVYVTPGYQMVALDARTGIRVKEFGRGGVVDLRRDLDQTIDAVDADIGLHAAPVIARDVIIVGAAHAASGNPKSRSNVKGYVRGYDVRTGKRLWLFQTIPGPGDPGRETWLNGSAEYTGNAGVWAQMSVDEELGLVYLPVESATGDLYGGDRPGANLYAESLVAVELKTGKRRWHYQLVHHGIWDWDIPCAPVLLDITVGAKRIKALAQPTKQAFLYVLDRETGQPVWPIEERPVPEGDVPGEWYSPTQPFPTRPAPYDRQGVTIDDLIDFTPELRAEAEALVARYRIGPLFTPPVVSKSEGPLATLMLPSLGGGTNWPGASYDPETGTLYVYSSTAIDAVSLVPADRTRTDVAYVMGVVREGATGAPAGAPPGVPSIRGLPLVKPPWGRITAIDMHTGDTRWQIAHGDTPDIVRNHPLLKGLTIPRTGRPGRVGTLVTRTLLIAGEDGMATTANGRRGAMLRAYAKATGEEVGAVYMPAPQTGSPMTYMLGGKQYIVVAVSGGSYSGELLAFRLPS